MPPNEKRLPLQKTLAGCLFAAALIPCAQAAPGCVMKFPDGSTHAGEPVHDEELGYCLTWEVLDPEQNGGMFARITYDSGKVRTMSASKAAALQIQTGQGGDFFQMGGTWPRNEYTRHLPDPDIAQDKAPGISVKTENGKPDDWHLVATWFRHDEDVFRQLTGYPDKLKKWGFSNAIRSHELGNSEVKDEKFPPDALMAFSYSATNSAGYRAEVQCGRPLQPVPDGKKEAAQPLPETVVTTAILAIPRLLPCTVGLKSPAQASRYAKEEADMKAREEKAARKEKARKAGKNRRKVPNGHASRMPG
jgi:hypothetical protein